MTTADYIHRGSRKEAAFMAIATALGPKHPLTEMMGSLAWGRHDAEMGPHRTLRTAIYRDGFLAGAFWSLNHWARDHDSAAQRLMLDIWMKEETP